VLDTGAILPYAADTVRESGAICTSSGGGRTLVIAYDHSCSDTHAPTLTDEPA